MKELLVFILDNILEENTTEVEESDDHDFITYTIFAPQEYMGKIIGKGGKTINAIKNILKIRAMKENKRIDVRVQEKA